MSAKCARFNCALEISQKKCLINVHGLIVLSEISRTKYCLINCHGLIVPSAVYQVHTSTYLCQFMVFDSCVEKSVALFVRRFHDVAFHIR